MYNINHVELYRDGKKTDFEFSRTLLLILVSFPKGNPPKIYSVRQKKRNQKKKKNSYEKNDRKKKKKKGMGS